MTGASYGAPELPAKRLQRLGDAGLLGRSAATGLRAYRMAQRWILPGDDRPPSARTLASLLFVTEHADAGCGRLPWRVFLENCNRTNLAALHRLYPS